MVHNFLDCIDKYSTFITAASTFFVFIATMLLAFFNCRLLKKYDRQHELNKFAALLKTRVKIFEDIKHFEGQPFSEVTKEHLKAKKFWENNNQNCPQRKLSEAIKNVDAFQSLLESKKNKLDDILSLMKKLDNLRNIYQGSDYEISDNDVDTFNSDREKLKKKLKEFISETNPLKLDLSNKKTQNFFQ